MMTADKPDSFAFKSVLVAPNQLTAKQMVKIYKITLW